MFRRMSNTSVLRVRRGSNGMKSLGKFDQLVTMAHPDLDMVLQTGKKLVNVSLAVESLCSQISVTIFASGAGHNVALVQSVSDFLQTVADSENRDAKVKKRGVAVRSSLFVDTGWATGENLSFFFDESRFTCFLVNRRTHNSFGFEREVGKLLGAREHFTVAIDLSQTTSNQMRLRKSQSDARCSSEV